MAHAEYQLTLPARTETDDDAGVAAVLGKAKAQLGMIPNMYARMANVPGLLETYLSGYPLPSVCAGRGLSMSFVRRGAPP